MNRQQLLEEMRKSVGVKDPIVFFTHMVSVFELVFDKLENLEKQNKMLQIKAALAIKWEPALALDMLDNEIYLLRQDRDIYHNEISALKKARMEDVVTQNYESFCIFWEDTLGYHPFLDYK